MYITLASFLITLITLLSIDGIWLVISAQKIYIPLLKHLFKKEFSYNVALLFYCLYAVGITQLIILPSIEMKHSLMSVALHGFLLGLVSYGAYDLTNQATLPNWPITITIIDMLWGACLTAGVSCITYLCIHHYCI